MPVMAIAMPTLRSGASTVVTTNEQTATFTRLVSGALTLLIGVLIFNEVEGALPSGGAINMSAITADISTAMELAPIALLVIVAALVLAQVTGFGR